jgi:Tfp pilus assembly protein FimT
VLLGMVHPLGLVAVLILFALAAIYLWIRHRQERSKKERKEKERG